MKYLKVLIIDDDPAITEVLARTLKIRRHVTVLANSPEEGLALNDGTFDLIVSDMEMPKMWGDTMLREMQRHGVAAPTILMSANWRELEKRKGLLIAGKLNVATLTKPFAPLGLTIAAEKLGIAV